MRRVRLLSVFVSATLAMVAISADAAEDVAGQLSPPYKAEDVRHMDEFVGSARAREMLLKQGFVVTDQQYRQVFEAYLSDVGSPLPKFITVDSAWHTYHVLLEDGVRQVELSQAGVLQRFSRRLHELAMGQRDKDEVYRDLAAFAAIGLALQDPAAVEQFPEEHRRTVHGVLAAIQGGGPPIEGILFFGLPLMPDQFRPVSFYAKTPELSRYFSARQWYATQVFRLKSDAETLRAIRLALLVESDTELKQLYARLTRPFDEIAGPADDPGLTQYAQIAQNTVNASAGPEGIASSLADFRREALRLPDPRVNDQWLLPREWDDRKELTRGMRVLGPRRLPSAVLFHETTAPAIRERAFPSGLDVFAAGPMACEAGRRALKKAVPNAATVDAILRADCGPLPDSLHGRAMRLLTLLQDSMPPTAPAVFRSSAWHDKQLGTGLAAWAEERHTWALQAKMTIIYGSMIKEPPGYVSPYPDFYRGLATLSRQAAAALRRTMPEGPDLVAAGKEWLAIMQKRASMQGHKATYSMEEEQEENRIANVFQTYCKAVGRDYYSASITEHAKMAEAIDAAARRCAEDKGVTEADRRWMTAFVQAPEGEALGLLPEFAALCDQLAAIAQKELDGKEFDQQDARLIRRYGTTLAKFHFYGGNSYISPRDDFPIAVPVFVSPYGNQKRILYAGVARPEAIYVIVSHGKRATLHRGAVLSYREFLRPINQQLDDDTWADDVRTGKTPPPPPWTASFRQTTGEQDVAGMIRAGKVLPGVSLMPGREITRAMIEALPQAAREDSYWLRDEIQSRATNEDIPALIEALAKSPVDSVGELAMCMAEIEGIDWKLHRDKLAALLSHERAQVADSAAYLMGCCPESIDAAALVADYERQPLRIRRLYLYVIGRAEDPGPRGEQLLLTCLDDSHAAIRYQAAAAVATCGVSNPAIIARLIKGIDDENQYTAAAMARALTKLGVKEAAPRMFARLKGDLLPTWGFNPETGKQSAPLTEGTSYGGMGNTQVLGCCPRRPRHGSEIGSLAEELIGGVGELKFEPARDELLALVHSDSQRGIGDDLGAEALDALLKIESQKKKDLLLKTIDDDKASPRALARALERITETQDSSYIEALLSLTDVPGHANNANKLTHEGYWAITRLLCQVNTSEPAGANLLAKTRDRFLQQIRGSNSGEAMDALFRIDRDTAVREALTIVLDETAPRESRSNAVWYLREARDPSYVEKILPLLQDESPGRYEGQHLCDDAAMAIAGICERLDPKIPDHVQTLALARAALQKMLSGPHGPTAVESLVQMERNEQQQAVFILRIAGDQSLAHATRLRALEMIAGSEDRSWLKKLLPLLDDQRQSEETGLSIGDHAANTIARLFGRKEWIYQNTPTGTRAEIIQKVRMLVEDE